jgi:molybdopterin-guanine dinucleotide biosynthesis protein A
MHKNVSGIILSGGKSIRMGQDKAFLLLGDKPLVEKVINAFGELFEQVLVVTNNPEKYGEYRQKLTIKEDVIPDKGPLGGIYSGLLSSQNVYNFIIACDMPFLNRELLAYIVNQAKNFDAVIPEYKGRLNPLFALYSKDCIPEFKKQISQDNLKIRNFIGDMNAKILPSAEVEKLDPQGLSFTNINTYGQYQSWIKKL